MVVVCIVDRGVGRSWGSAENGGFSIKVSSLLAGESVSYAL